MTKRNLFFFFSIILIFYCGLIFPNEASAQYTTGIIQRPIVPGASNDEIIVEWQTNIPEKSTLYWISNPNCSGLDNNAYTDLEDKTSHKYYLGAYNYEKICYKIQDSTGNETGVLYYDKPSIENVSMSDINIMPSANSVKITWTTNLPTLSTVYVKESNSSVMFYDTDKYASANYETTAHEFTITNLSPSTLYDVRLESLTSDGRLGSNLFTGGKNFYTLAATDTTENTTKPDLLITDVAYSTGYTSDGSQQVINFNVKYKNDSTVKIDQGVYFYVEAPADSDNVAIYNASAAVAGPILAATEYTADALFSYYFPLKSNLNRTFTFHVDRNETGSNYQSVDEANEVNNTFIKTVMISSSDITSDSNATADLNASSTDNQNLSDVKQTSGTTTASKQQTTPALTLAVTNMSLYNRIKGKILLKVEDSGEAWYVNPNKPFIHYLGRPIDAFRIMREQSIGITDANLLKVPVGVVKDTYKDSDGDGLSDYLENTLGLDPDKIDTDNDTFNDRTELLNGYNPRGTGKQNLDNGFTSAQSGRLFLQTEKNGEAWYVNPADIKRYFLGRPNDAFNIMRYLSLGISNKNFDSLIR